MSGYGNNFTQRQEFFTKKLNTWKPYQNAWKAFFSFYRSFLFFRYRFCPSGKPFSPTLLAHPIGYPALGSRRAIEQTIPGPKPDAHGCHQKDVKPPSSSAGISAWRGRSVSLMATQEDHYGAMALGRQKSVIDYENSPITARVTFLDSWCVGPGRRMALGMRHRTRDIVYSSPKAKKP